MRERARNVEGLVGEVEDIVKGCVEEVFSGEKVEGGEAGGEDGYRPTGGEGVLWDAVNSSGKKREAPKVRAYKKSILVSGV